MSMLEIKDLEVYYGMIQAIKGVSFDVNEGEVIALIGANGAGKTTILHTITGLINAQKGSVWFEGKDITKVPAHKIVSMGMAHVPEGRRVFANLTVLQNLKMGAYTRKDKTEIEQTLDSIYKRFPRLMERQNQLANGIPEDEVYTQWGMNCEERSCRRLGFLLSVNLRKGNRQLLSCLEEEIRDTRQELQKKIRKKGEEASTKLLFPMILYLIIVMILVIYPAYQKLGGI